MSYADIVKDWDSYDWETKGPELFGINEGIDPVHENIRKAFEKCREEIAAGDQYEEHYAYERFRLVVSGWHYWDDEEARNLTGDLLSQERKVRRGEAPESSLTAPLNALCVYGYSQINERPTVARVAHTRGREWSRTLPSVTSAAAHLDMLIRRDGGSDNEVMERLLRGEKVTHKRFTYWVEPAEADEGTG